VSGDKGDGWTSQGEGAYASERSGEGGRGGLPSYGPARRGSYLSESKWEGRHMDRVLERAFVFSFYVIYGLEFEDFSCIYSTHHSPISNLGNIFHSYFASTASHPLSSHSLNLSALTYHSHPFALSHQILKTPCSSTQSFP
jgi:hypothetical protein